MKMFTTIAVATAFLGLAACSQNEPAPAEPVAEATAPADNASAPAADNASAPAAETVVVQPVDGASVQPK